MTYDPPTINPHKMSVLTPGVLKFGDLVLQRANRSPSSRRLAPEGPKYPTIRRLGIDTFYLGTWTLSGCLRSMCATEDINVVST